MKYIFILSILSFIVGVQFSSAQSLSTYNKIAELYDKGDKTPTLQETAAYSGRCYLYETGLNGLLLIRTPIDPLSSGETPSAVMLEDRQKPADYYDSMTSAKAWEIARGFPLTRWSWDETEQAYVWSNGYPGSDRLRHASIRARRSGEYITVLMFLGGFLKWNCYYFQKLP